MLMAGQATRSQRLQNVNICLCFISHVLVFVQLQKVSNFFEKGMQIYDISNIINIERPDISLTVCNLLQHFQSMTASVERSFSMLQKLLANNRSFKIKNVKLCMILHFNFCTW